MRAYINTLVMSTPNRPNITWRDGKYEVLALHGIDIPLDTIRNVIKDLTTQGQSLLHSILMEVDGSYLKPLPITHHPTRDELPCEDTGYSFLTDPYNHFADSRFAVMERILTLGSKLHLGVTNGCIQWNIPRIKAYMGQAEDFLKVMAALIHLTYGGPARGEEFIKMKISNDPNGPRHLFWDGDCMVIITSYHKGSNLLGRDKVIPRYLPAHVSEML
jgi:hypothetical protein